MLYQADRPPIANRHEPAAETTAQRGTKENLAFDATSESQHSAAARPRQVC